MSTYVWVGMFLGTALPVLFLSTFSVLDLVVSDMVKLD